VTSPTAAYSNRRLS
jgi:hypothetical protein